MTDSRIVAEKFGKEHRNVLRIIARLQRDDAAKVLNFEQHAYVDGRGNTQPCYLMDQKAFSILVMGFTGREALRWKILFIETFEAMRAELSELAALEASKRTEALEQRTAKLSIWRPNVNAGSGMRGLTIGLAWRPMSASAVVVGGLPGRSTSRSNSGSGIFAMRNALTS